MTAAIHGEVARVCTVTDRYRGNWRGEFDARLHAALRPDLTILDMGAGRSPTLPPAARPPRCRYVGLDLSLDELDRAPAGSYDEIWALDVCEREPALDGRFDLVISFQVLEHVRPVRAALENLRGYTRPGGQLVAQLSGRFSAFGLINLFVPQRLGVWAMRRLLRRPPDTVFPAYYDGCWDGALARMSHRWKRVEIVPLFYGGGYFGFSPLLQRGYYAYEDWARTSGRHNLATHYVIDAIR